MRLGFVGSLEGLAEDFEQEALHACVYLRAFFRPLSVRIPCGLAQASGFGVSAVLFTLTNKQNNPLNAECQSIPERS